MANSIFIKADELAKELDISQGLAYKMIAQWNDCLLYTSPSPRDS